jgi:hypothetical protein
MVGVLIRVQDLGLSSTQIEVGVLLVVGEAEEATIKVEVPLIIEEVIKVVVEATATMTINPLLISSVVVEVGGQMKGLAGTEGL